MPKPAALPRTFDLLAVGNHPAAYIAAAVARAKTPKLAVGHISLPGEMIVDRLSLANPKLFELHPLVAPLKKTFGKHCGHGALFLSENATSRGNYACKTETCIIAGLADFTNACRKIAAEAGVTLLAPKSTFEAKKVVDDGVELVMDHQSTTARVLIVASPLSGSSAKTVGHSFEVDRDVVQSYRFVTLDGVKHSDNKQLVMSLDLAQTGAWAWLLNAGGRMEAAVMQPARRPVIPAGRDIELWLANLADHGIVPKNVTAGPATTVQLPVAGALGGETVANRTLLVGPAGGFISACNEQLYPGCWSAILAADVAVKALKERHVQDCLLSYREKWGSTVGDYLRGPQQNLKLLLPLIYRNPIMAARVGEAIFLGESVVR